MLENSLIAACIEGERSAQKALYDALAPKMYPICIRYMGDRALAEDILQEGFVILFTRLESYSGAGSFEGWARKIFINASLMSLRKKDALKMSEDIDAAINLKSETASPLQDIGYKDLMKMIAELPTGYRVVFNMYAIEGYNHKEISEALGITETTSRSQLHRARAMLQDKIKTLSDARRQK
jgi:RNA polymerase sigma-70 factor (ECF subfamily)